jgi:hypothetical protein
MEAMVVLDYSQRDFDTELRKGQGTRTCAHMHMGVRCASYYFSIGLGFPSIECRRNVEALSRFAWSSLSVLGPLLPRRIHNSDSLAAYSS